MHDGLFWRALRLFWLQKVLIFATLIGLVLTVAIVLVTLFFTGIAPSKEGMVAIYAIAHFWFFIAWTLGFLAALVLSFKSLFNRPMHGYKLLMLDCATKEPYEVVILLDVLPLWRKFLFWMVWILSVVALLLLGALGVEKTFFGGPTLFIMILFFGVLILKPLMLSMKNIRIRRMIEEKKYENSH